jgi:hypothetical protein
VIIIKAKKLLLSLCVFFMAFLFTGCFLFNVSPVIESNPITTAKEGVEYTYNVEATDSNEDTLTYSLNVGPTGMAINSATGVISWTPTTAGNFEVTVEVSDENKSETQSFIIVVDETVLTSIVVLPSSMEITAGNTKTITSVTAHYDNDTEASIALADCTYVSNNLTNVTVLNGVIAVSGSCTGANAIITVSYTENEVTKSDTVSITVPAPASGG